MDGFWEQLREKQYRVYDSLGRIDWEDKAIEWLTVDYDYDTAMTVNEFYADQQVPEGEHPDERYKKLRARLHRIYPERYLEGKYAHEPLNRWYSALQEVEVPDEAGVIPPPFYESLTLSDYEAVDAVLLDHSTIFTVQDRRSWQNEFIDEEILYGIGQVPWHKPIDALDTVLTWNDTVLEEEEIAIYHPSNIYSKLGEGERRHIPYETLQYMEEVSRPFELLNDVSGDEEDDLIINAAETLADNPLIITFDYGFKEQESSRGIQVLPPDLAHIVFQALLERDFVETRETNINNTA